jgi:hypothetical protein
MLSFLDQTQNVSSCFLLLQLIRRLPLLVFSVLHVPFGHITFILLIFSSHLQSGPLLSPLPTGQKVLSSQDPHEPAQS